MLVPVALVTALLSSIPAWGADRPPTLQTERHRLRNGLRIVLAPDSTLESTAIVVRYEAGSADDPEGKEGLAHLVEHLTYRSSRHLGTGDYARWVARAGGDAQGYTHRDYTQYTVTIPSQALPLALWLESERMGFAAEAATEQAVKQERWIIMDEARDIHCLRGSAGKFAALAFFPSFHPYHRNDCTGNVLSASLADVGAFMATWYQPSNATLIVVGPFEASPTLALADRYFGALRSVESPPRPTLPTQWPAQRRRVEVGAPGPRDVLTLQWRAPAFGNPEDAALDLAALVLVDSAFSLRREIMGLGAQGVYAREYSRRRESVFEVTIPLADGAPVDPIIGAVERAIAGLAAHADEGACDRARRALSDVFAVQMESALGRALLLADSDAPLGYDAHASISPTDVQHAVATYLVPHARTVAVLHHGKQYSPDGVLLSSTEQTQ